jgi:hypothetical protein
VDEDELLAMEAAMSAMLSNELSSTIMDSRSHTRTATLPPSSSSSHKNKDKAQQHHQQVHYVEPTSRNGVSGGGGKTTQYQDSGVDDARQLELEREIAFYKSITNHGGGGGGQEKKNHGTSLDIFAKGSIIGGDISQVKKVKTSSSSSLQQAAANKYDDRDDGEYQVYGDEEEGSYIHDFGETNAIWQGNVKSTCYFVYICVAKMEMRG